MKTLWLSLWLASGTIIHEPTDLYDCRILHATAAYVAEIGGMLERDGDWIVRLDCDDRSTVIALPESDGACDTGAGS